MQNKYFNYFSYFVIAVAVIIIILAWSGKLPPEYVNEIVYIGIFLIVIRLILRIYLTNKARKEADQD